MTDKARAAAGELHVHLDLGGLAALLKAVEAAMQGGVGRLDLGPGGCGIRAQGGSAEGFVAAIVTFAVDEEGGLELPPSLLAGLAAGAALPRA